MGLEDFVPSEDIDSGSKSAEVSEKFKESIKKGSAGIKRVKKDEQKARKYDSILAGFLVEIIKNKDYDYLHDEIFKIINAGYGSNIILGLISLIYEPISLKIREITHKDIIKFKYPTFEENTVFKDDIIDEELRSRITYWVEDLFDIVTFEYSTLQIKNIISLLNSKENKTILNFGNIIFCEFFSKLGVDISIQKAKPYIDFIVGELILKLKDIKLEEV